MSFSASFSPIEDPVTFGCQSSLVAFDLEQLSAFFFPPRITLTPLKSLGDCVTFQIRLFLPGQIQDMHFWRERLAGNCVLGGTSQKQRVVLVRPSLIRPDSIL